MRSSHQLCSPVPSIPYSSKSITERPSHYYFVGLSHMRSRSPTTSVPTPSPIPGALSPTRADLLPPPKRIRSSDFMTYLKDYLDESSKSSVPRETSLRDDVVVRGAERIDARVMVETIAREEVKTSMRGSVKSRVERVTHIVVPEDTLEPAHEEGVIEDYFSPDDSARDSSSDSSSEASSDFHLDASSDSSSRHSLSSHSSPDLPSTSAGPSRKRRRSPMTLVPVLSHISESLSPIHADLIPSPKRVRDSGYLADVEVDPRETSLRDDVIVKGSDEPHLEHDIDPKVQAEIDECIAYADALRYRGIDARVVVEVVNREESETGTRGPVEVIVERVMHPVMPEDTLEPSQEERVVECTYETLGSLVQRFHDHTKAIPVHRGSVTPRVLRVRGLTDSSAACHYRSVTFSDGHGVRNSYLLYFETNVMKMPNTRSRASMTHGEIEELVARRVAEEMEAREVTMNLEPLNENGDEQEGENGGNGNGGNKGNENRGNGRNGDEWNGENRNGNRNRNHGMNYGGFMPVTRECTFQDFLKYCKPHNFSGTEGVVRLTRYVSVQAPSGRVTDWYQSQVIENQVMAILVISISSDSSDDSTGTPAGRMYLLRWFRVDECNDEIKLDWWLDLLKLKCDEGMVDIVDLWRLYDVELVVGCRLLSDDVVCGLL
nr:hypothetical protein [Tanacetum cinerariifolium]